LIGIIVPAVYNPTAKDGYTVAILHLVLKSLGYETLVPFDPENTRYLKMVVTFD
jgi:hypothetical protein